jgi:hypothetical protein
MADSHGVDVLQRKGNCWPEHEGSHAYKNSNHRTARPDLDQRYCDQGEEKDILTDDQWI